MSTYTRQTYKLVAELLRNPPLDAQHRRDIAEILADQFAEDNPRFDRDLFLTAALPS